MVTPADCAIAVDVPLGVAVLSAYDLQQYSQSVPDLVFGLAGYKVHAGRTVQWRTSC